MLQQQYKMGFFDKAIKNIVKKAKPILPVAAMFAAPYLAPKMSGFLGSKGMGAGLGSLLKGYGAKYSALPMMFKAPMTSGLTSYGLARLMGQKNPEKAALYSAIASLPFAYMKAADLAKATGTDLTPFELLQGKTDQVMDMDAFNRFMQVGPPGSDNVIGAGMKRPMAKEVGFGLEDLFRNQVARKGLLGNKIAAGSFDIRSALPLLAGFTGGMPTEDQSREEMRRREKERMKNLYEDMINPYYSYVPSGFNFTPYEAGGAVSGPGGPKDDEINAKLSDGEFVMTAKAVQNMGNGSRMAGAKKMYQLMNSLDPESEKPSEAMV